MTPHERGTHSDAQPTRSTQAWRRQPTDLGNMEGPGLLESVWRYRWLVMATTFALAVLAYAASQLQSPVYSGEAQLLLADPREASAFGESTNLVVADGSRYVRKQAEYINSSQVMQRASERLGGALDADHLKDNTTVTPSEVVDLITVEVLAPNATLAAEAANAVAQSYEDVRAGEIRQRAEARIRELERSRQELLERLTAVDQQVRADPADMTAAAEHAALQEQMSLLLNRVSQISTDAALYGAGVEFFEPATPSSSPVTPKPARNAAVAAVLGLLGTAGFAWWRAGHMMGAMEPAEAAAVLDAPLLGTVPDFGGLRPAELAPGRDRASTVAEAYQTIITTLEVLQRDWRARSLLVTSARGGDGKTVTALNLAVAAINDGRSVLLVDADGRARELSRLAGTQDAPGLTDLRDDEVPLARCVVQWAVGDGAVLPFLPAGQRQVDPAGTYRSAPFRQAVRRLADVAEFVLADSAPVLAVSDTLAIAGQFDGIIVVVDRGTPLRLLEDLRDRLELVGTPVIGFVFNRAGDARALSYVNQRADGGGWWRGSPPATPAATPAAALEPPVAASRSSRRSRSRSARAGG